MNKENQINIFIYFVFIGYIFESNANEMHKKKWFTENNSSLDKAINNLSNEEQDQFVIGKSFFTIPWVMAPAATTARDGLGPLFNANTCASCHHKNGLGEKFNPDGEISRAIITKLSLTNGEPIPRYGGQIAVNGTIKTLFEGMPTLTEKPVKVTYPDGKSIILHKPQYGLRSLNYGKLPKNVVIVQRRTPALVGLGLLSKVSDQKILEKVDPDDKDNNGISGRANWLLNKDGKKRLGRFTTKASAATVFEQSATAAAHDMGLTNPLFPNELCEDEQVSCKNSPRGRASPDGTTLDLSRERLAAIAQFLNSTKVPLLKLDETAENGKQAFKKIGCNSCHLMEMTTRDGIKFAPYTDLLLHDMGEGLADNRREGSATGHEFKTAPLWGLSTYNKTLKSKKPFYLHDARARTIEEAILWHGGEAEKSKELFMKLPDNQRNAIFSFLNKL